MIALGGGSATHQVTVASTLIQLTDTLVSDCEVSEYLEQLVRRCCLAVAADVGAVLVADSAQRLDLVASTDGDIRLHGLCELQREQGPAVDCFERGDQVLEADLTTSPRWPEFRSEAVASGFRAACALPVGRGQHTIGALTLLRHDAGPISVDELRIAQTFAHMASLGIHQEHTARRWRDEAAELQAVLHGRVVLEQAKGLVAGRTGAGLDEAFQRLRAHARDRSLPLRVVAADIVAGRLQADELSPPRPAGPSPSVGA